MDLRARVRNGGDDGNELWIAHGPALIALAAELLASPDERGLGIRVIRDSLFEEEHENPEAQTSFAQANYAAGSLVAPLVAALASDETAVHALFALARHGVDVSAAGDAVVPLFAKGAAKPIRVAAFAVRVHALARAGKAADILPHLQGNAPLKAVLFDELGTYAARDYAIAPLLDVALKDLGAKGTEPQRKAVEVLWNLARNGVDLSAALPVLEARQVELAGFTNSSQVIAAALLRTGDRARLAAWIGSDDPKRKVCAYRGLRMARKEGLDTTLVFDDAALLQQLRAIGADRANRLPGLDE